MECMNIGEVGSAHELASKRACFDSLIPMIGSAGAGVAGYLFLGIRETTFRLLEREGGMKEMRKRRHARLSINNVESRMG